MDGKEFIYMIIGLCIMTGQIMAVVIMFGGWKNASKQWRISIGVALILMFVAVLGLTND